MINDVILKVTLDDISTDHSSLLLWPYILQPLFGLLITANKLQTL